MAGQVDQHGHRPLVAIPQPHDELPRTIGDGPGEVDLTDQPARAATAGAASARRVGTATVVVGLPPKVWHPPRTEQPSNSAMVSFIGTTACSWTGLRGRAEADCCGSGPSGSRATSIVELADMER